MRILDGASPLPAAFRGGALALGVMDGVHLGHQAVTAAARAHGRPLLAAVFEPPPRRHFQPDAPPFRLQTSAQRARALAALGVDAVIELPFDQALATIEAEAFAREILAARFGAAHVAVGFDFQFGRARAGDAAALTAFGAQFGFSVSTTAPVERDGAKVSSTRIRGLIAEGEVEAAAALLTRPWAIEGIVEGGQQRGRTIGFATANVALGDYVRPRFGVYAVRVDVGGAVHGGVANVGVRPTVGAAATPLLEAHLFDFSGDLYGRTIEAALVAFLRPEQKFESFEALKAQIERDVEAARAALR
ncbi:MAG: bifunctional riboflavin kinase/FAD synthetase [Hydrogenophilaceae bacterium]|jgi:riboflavin kinase/FMN adenylyltransferase|nr:bifunctional riboflavin kinase/FAD synthetase [Hydrogenophilaceae bacterium]